ncbi:MAG: hypothetical protein ABJB12_03970 [Pseudomonadota bacterium]
MTRFAWLLNLDAELELARLRYEYVPRQKLLRQLEEHGRGSRALLHEGDTLVAPGSAPPGAGFVGRAWCPTPRALAQFAALGVQAEPHPEAQVLRRVNHRLFAHEIGGGLPEQQYFTEREPLAALLRRAARPWLAKRPLAFAGRGQMRFYGPITEKQWSWLDVSLEQDGLIVEPLVTPTLELSVHGFLWRDQRCELGQVCVQQVTERGVFRGVRLALAHELSNAERTALLASAERVGRCLAAVRYFGPFGIDAYRYEVGSASGFCALSEINARYTMGFAVGFTRPASELVLD